MKLSRYIEDCKRGRKEPEYLRLVSHCFDAAGGDYLLAIALALDVLEGKLLPPSGRKDERPDGGGAGNGRSDATVTSSALAS